MNSLKGTAAFLVAALLAGCAASDPWEFHCKASPRFGPGGALANDDLIYVTNGNGEVTFYNLKTQKLVAS